ncbi:MAG: SWIM zinc finger family protein [Archangium sp.]|nr:SWIM zinc finger family protein [Archangium sp.]MDP3572060.1 SWIM zinc finger family protein [Archangium sp.]
MSSVRDVKVQYAGPSALVAQEGRAQVNLVLDASRGPVGVRGTVKSPALFRDALMAAFDVLGSDLRYKRKDLAVYLAYLTKQGKKANKEIWEAQKAFLEQQLGNEEKPQQVLEPVLTVSPDEISLEVFSRDESSYARLSLPSSMFEKREAAHGTTTLSVDEAFIARFERLRSWQPVSLEATSQPGSTPVSTRQVPLAWLRNFVQVQSASTLPAAVAELSPIDLYNLLFVLRTRSAKKPPRGLRFELVPGAQPRLVIEPFDIVLECHGAPYAGKTPRVVRIFGRQRLLSLARALQHVKTARVHLMGAGLPVFWALDFGPDRGSLTVGFTGWTDSGWSSASAFDALMPPASAEALAEKAYAHLLKHGPTTFDGMVRELGAPAKEVRAALQLECLKGRMLFDLVKAEYRPRQLLDAPIDVAQIRFGGEREKLAHRLLEGAGAVRLTKVHDLGSEGTELSGEVEDLEARRTFTPSFTLDPEGRVRGAGCTCLHFKRAGLREGPCEHLLALRIFHQRRLLHDEELRQTAEGRALIRAETRTFVRRETGKELVYRVSLDDKLVRVMWGPRSEEPRQQRTWFDSDAQAREAYFARLDSLTQDGFIDAG